MRMRRKTAKAGRSDSRTAPAGASDGGTIHDALEPLEATGISVAAAQLVSDYLLRHPDAVGPIEAASTKVAHEFADRAQLNLKLHRTIEEPEEYLLLNILVPSYTPEFHPAVRQLREQLEDAWPGVGEYLLVSTDFELPG